MYAVLRSYAVNSASHPGVQVASTSSKVADLDRRVAELQVRSIQQSESTAGW